MQKEKLTDYLNIAISEINDGNMSYVWGNHQEVLENRTKFLEKSGFDTNNCAVMSVTHGTDILIADQSYRGKGMFDHSTALKVDALMTQDPKIVLCLLIADCLPIVFYDPKKNILALAHMGWKSTNEKLAMKLITLMKQKFGSNPKDIVVSIGPGIHKKSSIFPSPVLQEKTLNWQPYLKNLPNNQTSVDNLGYNYQQLLDSGIIAKNIEINPIDTAQSPDYFSHYRSVRTGESEGRFMVAVRLK
ncbi:MAG: polyphenol oxidase family protein [bacterium]|nr:polyphenol oxidase family protein [bacterium]